MEVLGLFPSMNCACSKRLRYGFRYQVTFPEAQRDPLRPLTISAIYSKIIYRVEFVMKALKRAAERSGATQVL